MSTEYKKIIDDAKIREELTKPIDTSAEAVHAVLEKASKLKGIDYQDVLTLLRVEDEELTQEIFRTANFVKEAIYGNRLVLFAPMYISNLCNNECTYCAFRKDNTKLIRRSLEQHEIKHETEQLIAQGHKRMLLVAGEAYGKKGLDYVLESIKTVYATKTDKGNIRRINVNIAPLTVEEFKKLYAHDIGTYQLFQETYHRDTYESVHVKGPKSNYDFRLQAIDRAFEAGFDDVGIGVLFGLYDWKYEILALLQHINHLESTFGLGPHTISVPRLEPAHESDISEQPPFAVSDEDFKKIISVLRLAVPYTGIILSTRENAQMRRDAFSLGISQISAGSKTNPGGYEGEEGTFEEEAEEGMAGQFSLGDERPMLDVLKDVVDADHVPSFCTGCYRRGRVGADFMDLAKPGLIKDHCLPNGLLTFEEYLQDFADKDLKEDGEKLIQKMVDNDIAKEKTKKLTKQYLQDIKDGERDIYF
ncbi:MAG: [FeFe] hydrogenase H-cluster radical SAM maturase HydG [Fibrobacterales bacterium]